MPDRAGLALIALVAGLAMPAPVLAWGVPGCVDLPEYERALATLRGMASACGMSVEEARRIVAANGNRPGGLLGRLLADPPPSGTTSGSPDLPERAARPRAR